MNNFTYSNPKIKNNTSLFQDSASKNITIKSKKGEAFKIHDSVIIKDFETLYDLKKLNIKEYSLTKDYTKEIIQIAIDYLYTGSIVELNQKDAFGLAFLLKELGSKDLFSKVSDFLYDTTQVDDKVKSTNGSSSLISSFVILFAFSLLVGVFFFFNKTIEKLREDNNLLQNSISLLNSKFSSMKEAQKKEKSSSATEEINPSQEEDFTQINQDDLTEFMKRIDFLKQEMSLFKDSSYSKIISKSKNDFSNSVKAKQTKVNNEFLNKELDDIKGEVKYYRRYNETERAKLNELSEKPYSTSLVTDVMKRITEIQNIKDKILSPLKKNLPKFEKELLLNEDNAINQLKAVENAEKQRKSNVTYLHTQDKIKNTQIYNKLTAIITDILIGKERINKNLKSFLSTRFEYKEYYNKLYDVFNKNFNSKLIFNSNRLSSYDEIISHLSELKSRKNLLFFIQTKDNNVIGAYLSAEFPDISKLTYDITSINDPKSFIFFFSNKSNTYEIYKALSFSNRHIEFVKGEKSINLSFGSFYLFNGLMIRFTDTIKEEDVPAMKDLPLEERSIKVECGNPTTFYEEQKTGKFHNYSRTAEDQKIKSLKILELSFIN